MSPFWKGVCSIFEAFGSFNLFPPPLPPIEHKFERDDAEAIRKDWESVLGKWEQWPRDPDAPQEPHKDPDAPR